MPRRFEVWRTIAISFESTQRSRCHAFAQTSAPFSTNWHRLLPQPWPSAFCFASSFPPASRRPKSPAHLRTCSANSCGVSVMAGVPARRLGSASPAVQHAMESPALFAADDGWCALERLPSVPKSRKPAERYRKAGFGCHSVKKACFRRKSPLLRTGSSRFVF